MNNIREIGDLEIEFNMSCGQICVTISKKDSPCRGKEYIIDDIKDLGKVVNKYVKERIAYNYF